MCLSKLEILEKDSFPIILKNLLQEPCFLHHRRNTLIDYSRIEELGVPLSNRFELRKIVLYNNLEIDRTSLEKLAAKHLGLNVNKSCRDENFSIYSLLMHLQRYYALDVLVSRKLRARMSQIIMSSCLLCSNCRQVIKFCTE